MQIRPTQFNANGIPAVGFRIYIGQSNEDSTVDDNKLTVFNGQGGAEIDNPFIIDASGFPRATNGQRVYPWVEEEEYSIEWRTPNGTLGTLFYRDARFLSDSSGGVSSGGALVDAVINNFPDALTTDLTAFDYIFIQSFASAWEGQADGPVGGFFAYRNGNTGTPETGNPGKFFDAAGNEWKPADNQRLYAEMFGAVVGSDSFQAIQDMLTAGDDLKKACYFDGDEYLIATQSNTAGAYSLITTFAVAVPAYCSMIGNGQTKIRNETTDNNQYLFFGIDGDEFSAEGLIFDGNSDTADTGCLYLAGCTFANVDIRIQDSAPFYFNSSEARQGGTIKGRLSFKDMLFESFSGKSGGYKQAILDSVSFDACANGLEISREDIDSFSLSFVECQTSVDTLTGQLTGKATIIVNGETSIGSINCDCAKALSIEMNTQDIPNITIGSIYGVIADPVSATSSGGKVIRGYIGDLRATGVTTGVSITSTAQLVVDFIIQNIEVDGTTGLLLGDDTQLGIVRILGGTLTSTTGIDIDETQGQQIEIAGVDFTACTTEITGIDKSNWRAINCADFTYKNVTTTNIAYNLEDFDDGKSIIKIGSDVSFEYLRSGDKILTSPKAELLAFDKGIATPHLSYTADDDLSYLVTMVGDGTSSSSSPQTYSGSTFKIDITKRDW